MPEERDNSALAVAVFAGVHSHADQSCSPNTSLAFSRSRSIAHSGELFGSGRSMWRMPQEPRQSQWATNMAGDIMPAATFGLPRAGTRKDSFLRNLPST